MWIYIFILYDYICSFSLFFRKQKKVKKLLDTLFIIDDEKKAVNQHVYSFSELNQRDADYSRFRYNTYYE